MTRYNSLMLTCSFNRGVMCEATKEGISSITFSRQSCFQVPFTTLSNPFLPFLIAANNYTALSLSLANAPLQSLRCRLDWSITNA